MYKKRMTRPNSDRNLAKQIRTHVCRIASLSSKGDLMSVFVNTNFQMALIFRIHYEITFLLQCTQL